jgi:membrane protease YdiL (CAAX protease family)
VKRDDFGLLFALAFPTLSAWAYFEWFAKPEGADASGNPAMQAAWLMGKAIQFAFPLFWIWVIDRRVVWPSRPTLRGLRLGLGFGLLVAGLGLLFYYGLLRHHHLMRDAPALIHEKVSGFGAATRERFILFVSFLALVHSLLEEYYWRWFVFSGLQKRIPYWAAVVVSAIAFMAYHVIDLAAFFPGKFWTLVAPLSACIAVGGMVWAWLYGRTGSIYAPWLSHLLIDAAIFTAGYDLLFVRGT